MRHFVYGRSFRQCLRLGLVSALFVAASMPVLGQQPKSAGTGILPGSNSKEPINIDAEKLVYFDKEQKLVYTGNVVAVQGQSRLKTPSLVIFLMPKDSGGGDSGAPSSTNNQVRRMEASGPVVLSQKDQVGTGDRGVYIKADNKVFLYGNVVLTQGPNVTKGDQLEYDLTTSQALVTGKHVISQFVPNSSSSSGNEDNGSKKSSKTAGPGQNPGAPQN